MIILPLDKQMEKLYELPKTFDQLYREKKWTGARYIYNKAIILASFLELDDENMGALFGNRAYIKNPDDALPGLFREEKVSRVQLECIKMGVDSRTYINRAAEKLAKK